MKFKQNSAARRRAPLAAPITGVFALLAVAQAGNAQSIIPGDLIVTTSTYVGTASTIKTGPGGTILPGTTVDSKGNSVPGQVAQYNGSYPSVFNNAIADPSFGITSPIIIQQLSTTGAHNSNNDINITNKLLGKFDLATSFSSKSELAINLSPDGKSFTFMGYNQPVNMLDISNSNTPGVIEPGNFAQSSTYRVVAQLNLDGSISVTTTNAYNGNNPRAAILINGKYIAVGNAGNGNGSAATTAANGVQIITPGQNATSTTPGTDKLGSFSVAQINPATGMPYATPTQIAKDKASKDDNYRGETYYNGTLYISKGSGSNGINSVYSVDLKTGVINVLPGFSTVLARSTTGNVTHPFGLWFANPTTLYVADEGNQNLSDTLSNNFNAGVEKWSLVNGTWKLDYTLTNGLNLDSSYVVSDSNGDSVTQETDGLRNITGKINANGTVTIYGITSTVSTSGDQGADPNKLVAITDTVADTTTAQSASEQFTTLETAAYGQVLRGVALAPTPEPGTLTLFAAGSLAGIGFLARRRRK